MSTDGNPMPEIDWDADGGPKATSGIDWDNTSVEALGAYLAAGDATAKLKALAKEFGLDAAAQAKVNKLVAAGIHAAVSYAKGGGSPLSFASLLT